MDMIANFGLALIGLSFLIFVHELGHFLAAKRVGIRVQTFAIGFQPTIFGFRARFFAIRRGDTEYVLGMIPFGGYVKMAGEDPGDPRSGSGDEFTSKTVGERAIVLVAGSLMNLLFGFLLFIVALRIGFDEASAQIGTVYVNGPAWEAGVRPGDRVVSVNGRPTIEWQDLIHGVVLTDEGEPLTVTIERPGPAGAIERFDLLPRPTRNAALGFPSIGVEPALEPVVGLVADDSPALRAGIREDDRIVSVELVPSGGPTLPVPEDLLWTTRWDLILSFAERAAPGSSVRLRIEREGSESTWLEIPVEQREVGRDAMPLLGIEGAERTIAVVQPDSPAAEVFQVGWEIETLGDAPLWSLNRLEILRRAHTRPVLRFTTTTGESGEVKATDLLSWLGSQLVPRAVQRTVATVLPAGHGDRLGLRTGDFLLQIGTRPILGPSDLESSRAGEGATEVRWWDSAQRAVRTASLELPAGSPVDLGITLDERPRVGGVRPGVPAAAAGLAAGDVIHSINGQAASWTLLNEQARDTIPPRWYQFWRKGRPRYESKLVDLVWLRAGQEHRAEVTPQAKGTGWLGLGVHRDRVRIQTSVAEACVVGPRRAWISMVRIFMTLKALFTRQVDVKNLSGPVMILAIGTDASEQGIGRLLFILALLSINLGIFNLLPFPILDGGHLTFLAIEKIKGSPVSDQIQQWAFLVAFVLLISLALFVTYHDILRVFL